MSQPSALSASKPAVYSASSSRSASFNSHCNNDDSSHTASHSKVVQSLHLVVKLFKVSLHCIKYGTIDWAILTMRFSELFSIFVNKVCLIKLYDFCSSYCLGKAH